MAVVYNNRSLSDSEFSQIFRILLSILADNFLPFNQNEGARGVIVIVVGNEYGDTSSSPGRD